MTGTVDVDAYFRRIGYEGPGNPDLDTLQSLQRRHALAIAFENLDPLLRRPVRLDPQSLADKLLRAGRGGYCFEQNRLLSTVLTELGFRVTDLAARVVWNAPEGAVRPRSHMLLRIDLEEGPFLADVGFGGLTLTEPLRLVVDLEQPTSHEPFRLLRTGEDFMMQALVRGTWTSLYRFDLQPQLLPDYEVANWYVSTHPESIFLNCLMAALPTPDGRLALLNGELTHYRLGRDPHKRTLRDSRELRRVLTESFGITLPEDPGLDAVLARMVAQTI